MGAYRSGDPLDLMGGIKSVTAEAGFPGRDEISQLYARLSGRDLSDLQFYLAFAYASIWKVDPFVLSPAIWKLVGEKRDFCNNEVR